MNFDSYGLQHRNASVIPPATPPRANCTNSCSPPTWGSSADLLLPSQQTPSLSRNSSGIPRSNRVIYADSFDFDLGRWEIESISGNRVQFLVIKEVGNDDPVFLKISTKETRKRLLHFGMILTAHLGVYAFLLQVFQDYSTISKLLFSIQMALMIGCILYYLFCVVCDIYAIRTMLALGRDVGCTIIITSQSNIINTTQNPLIMFNVDQASLFSTSHGTCAELLICIVMLAVEVLTVMYFANNTIAP